MATGSMLRQIIERNLRSPAVEPGGGTRGKEDRLQLQSRLISSCYARENKTNVPHGPLFVTPQ